MDPGGHHVWVALEEAALKEPSAGLRTLAHWPLPLGARAGWAWVGPEPQKPLSGLRPRQRPHWTTGVTLPSGAEAGLSDLLLSSADDMWILATQCQRNPRPKDSSQSASKGNSTRQTQEAPQKAPLS